MTRPFYLLFGIVAYVFFFLTFLYLIAFVGNAPFVPRTVDNGPDAAMGVAIAINLGLIALFGLQHSVMARRGFKQAWTRMVPPTIERSVYVLAASAVLWILFLLWRPVPIEIWRVDNPAAASILWALFAAGWAIVLISTFLISHFELFGLRQVWLNLRGRQAEGPRFRQPLFYKLVRHPLYSGFLLAFWATPVMTIGHLVLALGMTAYILIAIRYEERDMIAVFGRDYEEYRCSVGMLTPRVRRSA